MEAAVSDFDDNPAAGSDFDAFEDAQPDEFFAGRVRDEDAEPWELKYAMWTHLGPLIGAVVLPFSNGVTFFIPALIGLILWRSRHDESPFIDDHGREVVNFHISIGLLFVLSIVLSIPTCGAATVIAVFGLPILAILGGIMAAVAANKGDYYRYPMTFRLIKPPGER